MDIIVSTHQLESLLDVERSTFTRWKKIGFDIAYISHGKYNLNKALKWWLENIQTPIDDESPTLQNERQRYEKARADKMEIQVKVLKGDLKPKDEIHRQWADRMAVVISGLTMYEGRLPPLLEGKTQGEMRQIIKKENNRLRDWYCKAGGR